MKPLFGGNRATHNKQVCQWLTIVRSTVRRGTGRGPVRRIRLVSIVPVVIALASQGVNTSPRDLLVDHVARCCAIQTGDRVIHWVEIIVGTTWNYIGRIHTNCRRLLTFLIEKLVNFSTVFFQGEGRDEGREEGGRKLTSQTYFEKFRSITSSITDHFLSTYIRYMQIDKLITFRNLLLPHMIRPHHNHTRWPFLSCTWCNTHRYRHYNKRRRQRSRPPWQPRGHRSGWAHYSDHCFGWEEERRSRVWHTLGFPHLLLLSPYLPFDSSLLSLYLPSFLSPSLPPHWVAR